MHTVFILGAGASRQAGGPLMSDFFDKAEDLVRRESGRLGDAKGAFDDVLAAVAELQAVHDKAYLDLNNIEALFGAVEMGALLGRYGKRDAAEIARLRDSLVTLIHKTLDCCIGFPVTSPGVVSAPPPYPTFVGTLSAASGSSAGRQTYALLTFNYDICLA